MSKENPHIMLIVGESSGELLALPVVEYIKKNYPNARISAVGGEKLKAAGAEILFSMQELNIMGIAEVVPHLNHLFSRREELYRYAEAQGVDLLFTVDAPDFNLRVAKFFKKKLGIPCVHYVSPSVWAWKKGRARKMAKFLDHLFLLFPFEMDIYKKVGLPATFVGHNVAMRLEALSPEKLGETELDAENLKIALLPGSRTGVISRMWPVMLEVLKKLHAKHRNIQTIIPLANEEQKKLLTGVAGMNVKAVVGEERFEALQGCHAAVATSGTSNLELAMLGIPTVVGYKMSGLTYAIASLLINIPYASPVNWALGRQLLPEFIQGKCSAENILKELEPLLKEGDERTLQLEGLQEARTRLLPEKDVDVSEKITSILFNFIK